MNSYGELYNASKKRLAGQMQVLNLSLSWKRWGGLFVLFCWNLSQTQKYWLVRYWRPTANFVG